MKTARTAWLDVPSNLEGSATALDRRGMADHPFAAAGVSYLM
jgi:hypothetical protein